MAVWTAGFLRTAVHIAFQAQRVKLAPVMNTFRLGLLPLVITLGFAPAAQAHCVPGDFAGGAGVAESAGYSRVLSEGISLDEAVRRAEAQYRARVVRTEVQDEDGRKVYVLKLLSEDGRVIMVRIDAATGRMR